MSESIKIDNRIKALLSFLENSKCLADIGCDHGFTCVSAVMQEKAKYAIAADISEPSLNKAKRLAYEKGLADHFDFRCGDGLAVLKPNEADSIIISGVGGELLIKILDEGKEKISKSCRLILSPNNREHLVRVWLCENGFEIDDESVVFERGKYYQVISAMRGSDEKLNKNEIEFGPINLSRKDEVFQNYIDEKIKSVKIILDNIVKNDGNKHSLEKFENRLNRYLEIKDGF